MDNNQLSEKGLDLNPLKIARLLLKRKYWIIGTVITVVFLTAVRIVLQPNIYTSVARILPTGPADKFSESKSIAGFSGFSIGDKSSSALYPVILNSQLIHDSVIHNKYKFRHKNREKNLTLVEYFGGDNPDILREALQGITDISMDKTTGVLTFSVKTKYPELSRLVAESYLSGLENFNIHKRKSEAKERAEYLAGQLRERKRELEESRNNLEEFQKVNRDWSTSTHPEIIKSLSELQMEIEIKSKTYLFLSQEYEIAKLDARKDVPIVRILDKPSLPVLKSGPKRKAIIMAAGLISLFGAMFLIIIFEIFKEKTLVNEKESFDALRKEVSQAFPALNRFYNGRLKKAVAEYSKRINLKKKAEV